MAILACPEDVVKECSVRDSSHFARSVTRQNVQTIVPIVNLTSMAATSCHSRECAISNGPLARLAGVKTKGHDYSERLVTSSFPSRSCA